MRLADDRVGFAVDGGGMRIDGAPPVGHGAGEAPLDLFLRSFLGCMAVTLASLLRDRVRCDLRDLHATAHGPLRAEHPRAFQSIALHFDITSPDAREDAVARAVASAEQRVCPISAMIRGNVPVTVTFALHRPNLPSPPVGKSGSVVET